MIDTGPGRDGQQTLPEKWIEELHVLGGHLERRSNELKAGLAPQPLGSQRQAGAAPGLPAPGIEPAIGMHTLRHTHASSLVQAGVSSAIVAEALGDCCPKS